jgi:hypothetical protein
VLYGFPPRHLGIDVTTTAPVPDLRHWLEEHELLQDLVRLHLQCAQDRIPRQADKGRSERTFHPGDSMFLKLQPYVQSTVARAGESQTVIQVFRAFQDSGMDWQSGIQA